MKLLKDIRVWFSNKTKKNGSLDSRKVKTSTANIVYMNAYTDICYNACKECYRGKISDLYSEKLRYIQAKVKAGHESVIEHSNIVIMLDIQKDNLIDLMEVLAYNRFLVCEVKQTCIIENEESFAVLIGGSILGYKQLIRRIPNLTNSVLQLIIGCLYQIEKEYFYDLIQDGVMDVNKFIEHDRVEHVLQVESQYDRMQFFNVDDIDAIYRNTNGIFEYRKLLKFMTITVYFKEMSRIITQQVTRHRNAISQKSQRYVDETNAKFFSPIQFRDDKSELEIEWAGQKWNSQELGEFLQTAYAACKKAGMKSEEARSYLPTNTVSSLYVTFRGDNFIHFIDMRNDPHAQAEIRQYGKEMERMFSEITSKCTLEDMRTLIAPEYIQKDKFSNSMYDNIDEVIE